MKKGLSKVTCFKKSIFLLRVFKTIATVAARFGHCPFFLVCMLCTCFFIDFFVIFSSMVMWFFSFSFFIFGHFSFKMFRSLIYIWCLQVLTKDSVTVSVDAVVYYRVSNATVSVANVENAHHSTRLLAQTTLRNILGTKNLHEILSDRESISGSMQVKATCFLCF